MALRLGSVLGWFEVATHRAALYRLALIFGPLLIAAGFLTPGQFGTDLQILGAVLGVGGNGLAARHTKRRPR